MNIRFLSLTLCAALLAFPAFALDLHQARASGMVGEKLDGYVGVIQSSPEAARLAADVNAKRQQEYARIAKSKGQPVDVVAKLAAGQVISRLAPGEMYQAPDGSWKKK